VEKEKKCAGWPLGKKENRGKNSAAHKPSFSKKNNPGGYAAGGKKGNATDVNKKKKKKKEGQSFQSIP